MKSLKLSNVSAPAAKYKHIRSWGRNMRSMEFYITQAQEKAARDGAPEDALYFSTTENKWVCASDLRAEHAFHEFHKSYWENM